VNGSLPLPRTFSSRLPFRRRICNLSHRAHTRGETEWFSDIRKHRDRAEQMIENLQRGSREAVIGLGERRSDHPVWGGPGWKVFLDSEEDIRRTVRYVEQNPTKARRPAQSWDFVTAYDGWPFHRRRG
jgi:hypothetical protein